MKSYLYLILWIATEICVAKSEAISVHKPNEINLISEFSANPQQPHSVAMAHALKELGFPVLSYEFFATAADKSMSNSIYKEYVAHVVAHPEGFFPYGKQVSRLLPADQIDIPAEWNGFFLFHRAIEGVERGEAENAIDLLKKISPSDPNYIPSVFLLGILEHKIGKDKSALHYFTQSLDLSSRQHGKFSEIRNQSALNIARIYYEHKKYKEAIHRYSVVSEKSENWLQGLLESAWIFYLMDKPENALGNLQTVLSSFFQDRFYPEAYLLRSIVLSKRCNFKSAVREVSDFQKRYKPILNEMKIIQEKFQNQPDGFYEVVEAYISHKMRSYVEIGSVLDQVLRSNDIKREYAVLMMVQFEIERAEKIGLSASSTLFIKTELMRIFEEKKKSISLMVWNRFKKKQALLEDIFVKSQLVTAQTLLGNLDVIRSELQVGKEQKQGTYIAGLKQLKLGQRLEYWPYEKEDWRDEVGGYISYIKNLCVH